MKKLRFITILSIALVLILVTVFQASAFTYFIEPINNTITKDGTATFSLLIRNTADYDDFFSISTRDVNWLIDTEPASGLVPAGEDTEPHLQSLLPENLYPYHFPTDNAPRPPLPPTPSWWQYCAESASRENPPCTTPCRSQRHSSGQ